MCATRPRSVDLSTLTLGSIDDPDGFGIGHMPVQEAEFRGWHPQLLAMTELTEEELEGYEMWKEAQGGAFGN
jgi:hypothetical protein